MMRNRSSGGDVKEYGSQCETLAPGNQAGTRKGEGKRGGGRGDRFGKQGLNEPVWPIETKPSPERRGKTKSEREAAMRESEENARSE